MATYRDQFTEESPLERGKGRKRKEKEEVKLKTTSSIELSNPVNL